MSTQPVGLSAKLAPKQVMRVQLEGADLAVWRSVSGVISAWENRCPHRGMRLSHGFVRGESLACAYHGWHYDCSGQCRKIPAHPELQPPDTIRAIDYSVLEQSGIVWVNTLDAAQPVALPDNLRAVRSLTFNCELERVEEALLTVPLSDGSGSCAVPLSKTVVSDEPKVLSFAIENQPDSVWIALQQQDAQSTVAHVLAGNTLVGHELVSLSRWCEAARRRAENAQTVIPSSSSKSPGTE